MFRAGPLMAVPAVLAEHGVDAVSVLAEFGLAASIFDDPENVLSFVVAARLLARCAELAKCPHFSLLVGQRAGPAQLGPVGYLMMSSPNVGTALDVLVRHLNVQDRGAVAATRVEGGYVTLSYAIVEAGVGHVDAIYGIAMMVGQNIMRGLCGPDWRPSAVTLAFGRPADVEPYRVAFGVAPRFDEVESALIFPERTLRQPLASADVMLHKLMEQRVRELEFRAVADVVEQVRRLLRVMLTSGAGCSLAEVALRIGTHERSLKRRLGAAGTSFRELREDVRFEAACQLLANTAVPVGEIGTIVGYADPSAFTHAFQRWAGLPPAQWRAGQARRRGSG